jgi:hypothetical protein
MRPLAAAVVVAITWSAAIGISRGKPPGADLILRKAEEVRNPDLDYAVDFAIHGVAHEASEKERDATYSMIAGGKDRTVILMRAPESLYGALMLMANGRYWMLHPKAQNPRELSIAPIQNGDVATVDLSRANLTRGYKASLSGEEDADGEACWRLELTPDGGSGRFSRILYWVAKAGFRPRRLEFYGRAGALLKTVRYSDYRKGPLGLRSMTLTIESLDEWKETSTLTFSNLRKFDVRRASFTPEGLIPLRDAALAAREASGAADASLETIAGGRARLSEPSGLR